MTPFRDSILEYIMKKYKVLKNDGEKYFVKEYDFFVSQGGLDSHWGRNWKTVLADSIEHARLIAEDLDWPRKTY